MKTRLLGQSGIEATVVGLGTWAMGGWLWGGIEVNDSENAIRAAIDAGITLIDTAPAYGLGLSEEIVGKAIAGKRDQLVIATKCGLVWDTQKGTFHYPEYDKKLHRYLGADSVRREVEQSLQRLHTDRIDLLQTHWQDETTPIEETMETLLELKQEGKIRAIGVSNATVEQIDTYRQVGPLDTDQEKYSMIDRRMDDEHLPYCQKNGVGFLAYSPMSMGLLSGKIGPDREFSGDDLRQGNPRFAKENLLRVQNLMDAIRPIAKNYDAALSQLILAWTAEQPGVTHVLAGARNPRQAMENARAGEIQLTPADIQAIDAIYAERGTAIV